MKIHYSHTLLLFLSIHLGAQDFDISHLYPIESSHSYVQFEATYMGYAKVRGNFGDFKGSIYYDPENPDQTSISFQINVESINTNNDWRDRDLKSKNWFLVEEHPHIRFSSHKVTLQDEGFKVVGTLAIKETSKQIEFSIPQPIGIIQDIRGDDQVIFTGTYTLDRKEFGVMGSNWSQVKEGIAALSDEVSIEFSLLGKQMKADNFSNFLRSPKRPPGAIYQAYQEGGLDAALERYQDMQQDTAIKLNSHALNTVGYFLLLQEKYEDAEALMLLNLKDYTDDPNVYDSLGELHATLGNLAEARKFYEKSLLMDSTNMNASEVLKLMQAADQ